MPFLNFTEEAHAKSTSWERADPDAALLERVGTNQYLVMLPGVEAPCSGVHECRFGTERGGHVGFCDCKGFEFRDDQNSLCAHLCMLRQAKFIGDRADDGELIEAVDTFDESGDAAVAEMIEPELRADGGRPAAGEDGREFSRPISRRLSTLSTTCGISRRTCRWSTCRRGRSGGGPQTPPASSSMTTKGGRTPGRTISAAPGGRCSRQSTRSSPA